jgi:hypothetical protein
LHESFPSQEGEEKLKLKPDKKAINKTDAIHLLGRG